MKVAIKGKGELKYVDAENLLIKGEPITKVFEEIELLREAYEKLVHTIRNSTIIRDGDILSLNGELKEVKDPKVFEKPSKNLVLYKVENGKLILDKRKVGVV